MTTYKLFTIKQQERARKGPLAGQLQGLDMPNGAQYVLVAYSDDSTPETLYEGQHILWVYKYLISHAGLKLEEKEVGYSDVVNLIIANGRPQDTGESVPSSEG